MAEEKQLAEPPANGVGILKYDLDLASEALTWSDELHTIFGYEKSAAAYNLEWWAQHIHHDDAMILNEAMDRLLYPWVKEWTVSYRFQKADNTYVLVHDRATVVRSADGKATRLTGMIWQG